MREQMTTEEMWETRGRAAFCQVHLKCPCGTTATLQSSSLRETETLALRLGWSMTPVRCPRCAIEGGYRPC